MKQSDLNNYQPHAQSISMKLGRHIIAQLNDFAMKESMRRQQKVTMTELIKDAIKHTYPFIKD
jgi:hypothetical protein